jgi:hypothetical protein
VDRFRAAVDVRIQLAARVAPPAGVVMSDEPGKPLDYRTPERSTGWRWYEWLFVALCAGLVLYVVVVFITLLLSDD